MAGFPEDWEPLVFELTLSGEVDAQDTFAVEHQCQDSGTMPECAFIEPQTVFCSGDEGQQEDWGSPPCAARTYRLELKREAGVTINYALLRWSGSFAGEPIRMLRDSVTVPEGGITLRLGYDYSLGSNTPSWPALPDTAAGPATPTVPAGIALLVTALAVALPRRKVAGRT